MAHALPGYDGKCRNIHGHCYKLILTVSGTPQNLNGSPREGMVTDFSLLAKLLKREVADVYDHSLVLPESVGKPLQNTLSETFDSKNPLRLVITPFQPTTENLLTDILSRLNGKLPEGVRLVELTLSESDTSSASWHLYDQNAKSCKN